jgi:hypothetical protein
VVYLPCRLNIGSHLKVTLIALLQCCDYFDISIQNEMHHLIDAINLYKAFIIDQFALIPDI